MFSGLTGTDWYALSVYEYIEAKGYHCRRAGIDNDNGRLIRIAIRKIPKHKKRFLELCIAKIVLCAE